MKTKSIFILLISFLVFTKANAQDLNPKIVADYRPASSVLSVSFSPDGKYLATGSGDNTVKVYRVNNGSFSLIKSLDDYRNVVWSVSFSPDGKYLATGSYFPTVKVYSVSDGSFSLIKSLEDNSSDVESVSFSPDGKYLATGSNDNTVKVYRVSGGSFSLIKSLDDHSDAVWSVSFSPDGKYLATGSEDKTVKVYRVSGGSFSLIKSLDDHSSWVESVSFSPDGKYLATGSGDNTVKVYRVNNGSFSLIKSLDDHSGDVESVSFSPDGKYLATGGDDHTVKIYRVSGGIFSLIKSLDDHSGDVESVSFSPDGKYLATGGGDGTIIYGLEGVSPAHIPVTEPAILTTQNASFTDANGNGILEAGEKGFISIDIKNIGKGSAYNLQAKINISPSTQGITYTLPDAINLSPNTHKTISIPIETNIDLPTRNLSIEISFTEANGFQPPPVRFNITTQEKAKPQLALTSQTTEITKQAVANANFKISNTGIGTAEDVKIKYILPQNVFATDKLEYDLGNIPAKKSKTQEFSFLVTANYVQNTLPIQVEVSEKYGKFGVKKTINLNVTKGGSTVVDNTKPIINITQPATANYTTNDDKVVFIGNVTSKNALKSFTVNGKPISLSGGSFTHSEYLAGTNNTFTFVATDVNNNQTTTTITVTKEVEVYSVDADIPTSGKTYNNRYALIISNANYQFMTNLTGSYTLEDGKYFAQYAQRVLGIPSNNVYLVTDGNNASLDADMPGTDYRKLLNRLTNNSEVVVFYSGHGIVDNSKTPYFLPVDAYVDVDEELNIKVKNGKPIKDLLDEISAKGVKQITVFVDACFTGTNKEGGGLNDQIARNGVHLVVKNGLQVTANTIYISGTSGDSPAYPYRLQKHGLFTYALLKVLKDTKGNLTYGELFSKVKQEMSNIINAPGSNFKENQVPTTISTMNNWQLIKVNP